VTALRTPAPAKLNLWLRVVGRRADGLHELSSEMVLLELADDLLLLAGASGLRVEADDDDPVPRVAVDNLAWRGLGAGLGREPQLECLILRKRIPAAAGLGGGSSDAAAAWMLGRAWRGAPAGVPPGELASLAEIGADVPFFAAAMPRALIGGVGERVDPRPPLASEAVVLALPPFRLATAAVFAELRAADWSGPDGDPDRNDLLAPARRLRPELDDLFRLVVSAGGRPQLTGSGPATFFRTDDPDRAAAVAARLRRAGLRVWETRLRSEAGRIEQVSDEEEES
jgi:4-diphosphocytidyl-2-C-methyl-D-erythritol kinase